MEIKHLKNFKIAAARSCGKPIYNIDWFEVDTDVFKEYGINEDMVSDPYYIGACIDFAIHELNRLIGV